MSATITIDRSLLRLDKSLIKALVTGLKIAGDVTQNEIKKIAPKTYTERTGSLTRSILRDPVNKNELSVTITATVGTLGNKKDPAYGVFVNDGTKYIRARRFMERGQEKASKVYEPIFKKAMDKYM